MNTLKKTCGRKHPRQIVIIMVNLRKLFYSIWYFWMFLVLRFLIDYQQQITKSNFKIIFKNCIMIHLLINIIQIRKKASTTGHEISFLLFMVMKILYSRNLNNDERFYVIYELFWKINLDYFYENFFKKEPNAILIYIDKNKKYITCCKSN